MTITINGSGTITGATTLATTVASPAFTTPNIDSAQIPTVSGTAPLYMCRAWVNFNGTGTVAILASGNVTSITDNGTGDYTVNFTTAMTDANYSAVYGTQFDTSATSNPFFIGLRATSGTVATKTTSAIRISTWTYSGAGVDTSNISASIFR